MHNYFEILPAAHINDMKYFYTPYPNNNMKLIINEI